MLVGKCFGYVAIGISLEKVEKVSVSDDRMGRVAISNTENFIKAKYIRMGIQHRTKSIGAATLPGEKDYES
jgi:hypothetical protein